MIYTLSNNKMTVKISDQGAEIQSVVLNGKERVWQNENGMWDRHSPVLFPVCGRTSVIVNGTSYPMPFHGFARELPFTVRAADGQSAVFTLHSSDETRKVYPFDFELTVSYTLKDNAVIVSNEVKNTGTGSMRFALGRHDSFSLDDDPGCYKLCFPKEERFLSQQYDNTSRRVDDYDDLGGGNVLLVPENILSSSSSVTFQNLNSDRVILKTLDDRPVASIVWGEIKNLLLWHPLDAKMICIEPWSALPDRAGGEPDFLENPRFFALQSGERKEIGFEIRYW